MSVTTDHRFEQLADRLESFIAGRIQRDARLGQAVAQNLYGVLANCDEINFDEIGVAEAYACLHFLDRYHRFQLTYQELHERGLMPGIDRRRSRPLQLLDVGTGPGPSMFAASDFYAARWSRGRPSQGAVTESAIRIDYVERAQGFRNFLHHFTEHANWPEPDGGRWLVPFHHGTFSDFDGIRFERRAFRLELEEDGWETVQDREVRRFNAITASNFFTSVSSVERFRESLHQLAAALRRGGVLIVVGAPGTDGGVYGPIYDAIRDAVCGWSSDRGDWMDVGPSLLLTYSYGDAYGVRIKQFLTKLLEGPLAPEFDAVEATTKKRLLRTIDPDYSHQQRWQAQVFVRRNRLLHGSKGRCRAPSTL